MGALSTKSLVLTHAAFSAVPPDGKMLSAHNQKRFRATLIRPLATSQSWTRLTRSAKRFAGSSGLSAGVQS